MEQDKRQKINEDKFKLWEKVYSLILEKIRRNGSTIGTLKIEDVISRKAIINFGRIKSKKFILEIKTNSIIGEKKVIFDQNGINLKAKRSITVIRRIEKKIIIFH